jgi:purine-binding chemotaxis protein CheW
MTMAEQTVNTCVIIVEVELDGEKVVMGAMADAIQNVLDLEPDQTEPPPRIGTRLNTDFLHGMGKHLEQFLIILDIDKVFSASEPGSVRGASRIHRRL